MSDDAINLTAQLPVVQYRVTSLSRSQDTYATGVFLFGSQVVNALVALAITPQRPTDEARSVRPAHSQGRPSRISPLCYDTISPNMTQGAPPGAAAVRSLATTQDNDTAQTFFISGFGATMLLVLCCLSWRTLMDYCRGPPHSTRHRAFAKRSCVPNHTKTIDDHGLSADFSAYCCIGNRSPSWLCQTCYHANDEAQKRCVLCGTPPEGMNRPCLLLWEESMQWLLTLIGV